MGSGLSGREGVRGGEQYVSLQCGTAELSEAGPGSGEVLLPGVSGSSSRLWCPSFGISANETFLPWHAFLEPVEMGKLRPRTAIQTGSSGRPASLRPLTLPQWLLLLTRVASDSEAKDDSYRGDLREAGKGPQAWARLSGRGGEQATGMARLLNRPLRTPAQPPAWFPLLRQPHCCPHCLKSKA